MLGSAAYASPLAIYGHFQLGAVVFAPPRQAYGYTPFKKRHKKINKSEEDTTQEPTKISEATPSIVYAEEVAQRNAIIRELRAKIKYANDIREADMFREQRRVENEAMLRASKLKNTIDDEEALFILSQ